jgi:hypothetical protein
VTDDPYWSVDIPGLREEEARQLLQWASANRAGWFGNGTAVDPREWLTLNLDRESVQMLLDALRAAPNLAPGADAMAEDFADWLASTSQENKPDQAS